MYIKINNAENHNTHYKRHGTKPNNDKRSTGDRNNVKQ